MPTPNFCVLPNCLIPLGSREPIWEWNIVTDSVFFSLGARESLRLPSPPATMQEFCELLPQAARIEFRNMHEELVSGKSNSMLECNFICNGLWATEYLLVISRDTSGRATRAIGRLTASPALPEKVQFCREAASLPDIGVWAYHIPTGRIWRDSVCSNLLGIRAEVRYPISSTESTMAVHPSDRMALERHYHLFCQDSSLGESITDMVRVRQANGTYTSLLVRASMAERDENGRGLFIVGVMARCESGLPGVRSLSPGEGIFNALNNMGTGQWNWDTKLDIMYFCPRSLAMLGYDSQKGREFGKEWRNYIHPDDSAKVCAARDGVLVDTKNGDAYECTYRMLRSDGSWAWIFDRGFVTWRDADGRAGHMVGSITNITTAQADRDRLEELVRHDSLTGLRSRAYCNLEMEHLEKNHIRPVSIISVDITGLKMINDNLGHLTGDEILTRGAALLRGALRATDCIGRMGGDEFLVLLPKCSHAKGMKLLRKIETAFAEYNMSGSHIPVFAACGLATAEDMEETVLETIARADDAMYKAKKLQRSEAFEALKAWIIKSTGKPMVEDDRLV